MKSTKLIYPENLKNSSGINSDDNIKSEITDVHNDRTSTPKSSNKNFRTLLLFLILFFCSAATLAIRAEAMHDKALQTGIAEQIIRFHVIANSDSKQDQALKLIVRDTLIANLEPLLKPTQDLKTAEGIILRQLPQLCELAEETIRNNGYDYQVKVSLEECYFPLKIYGEYTFPPGYYQALRVQIGEARGKNWWCVMFPPLCFVDETYSIVDEDSGKKLKTLLTEEEYNTLTDQDTPVKIKFKLWEAIKKLFE